MKKALLIILNISIIIPCIIFGNVGTSFIPTIWLITFVMSLVNLVLSNKRKEFLIYSLILLVFSSIGMYINGQIYFGSLADKQIWYDLEGDLTYYLATVIHLVTHLIIMSIEFLIKVLVLKRKTNGI